MIRVERALKPAQVGIIHARTKTPWIRIAFGADVFYVDAQEAVLIADRLIDAVEKLG